MRLFILLAVCLPLVLTACRPADRGAKSDAAPVLKIGSQKGSTRALLEASGVLRGAPYSVTWSEFGAASPLLEAISDGAVDVGGVGDAPFVFAYAAGAPIRAIWAYRTGGSASSVAIIAPESSPVHTPADLAGRKVATVRGSVGHYLLIKTLQNNHIPAADVRTVFLDPGSARGALSTGAVDAWSTWSPYVGYGLLHDHDHKVADGQGVMSGIGFMAANAASIRTKGPLLNDFVQRLSRAYEWGRAHPQAYAKTVAADTGLPLDVARDMAQRLTAHPAPMDEALQRDEGDTLSAFRQAGVIATTPSLKGAFDRQFEVAARTSASATAPSGR